MSFAAALLLFVQATPETQALGEELASYGTLAALGPLVTTKETEDLVAAHPELTAEEKDALRATGKKVAAELKARAIKAEGAAFANSLSAEDLRNLIAAARSPAAQRQRAAMPRIIADTMKGLSTVDYKGSVLAAYCAQYGKLCSK